MFRKCYYLTQPAQKDVLARIAPRLVVIVWVRRYVIMYQETVLLADVSGDSTVPDVKQTFHLR
ncbi:hypothetical protein MAR_022974 [Mya arenaria]|uniref:Uncharacterized protein n=1 Tax=Mya arenaria TaxID=6604 RepID=A0ABY7DPV2_MYAAR|nr:hypothetical protein MAR_022974 [Mya arenaria]